MNEQGLKTYSVYELEVKVCGARSSHSKTPNQRKLRKVLRKLGYGVGHGNKYLWNNDEDFHVIVEQVKKYCQNFNERDL